MRRIIFLISLFYFSYSYSQGYNPINIEDVKYLDRYSKEGFGFAEDIPSRSSLEKYVPIIGNQGQTGSCVAWATTYYNLSIVYNSMFEITNTAEKFMHSFDPWFTFTQLNSSNNCMGSIHPIKAMEFIMDYGAKKLMFPPYDLECNQSISQNTFNIMKRYLAPYKIDKFESIWAKDLDPWKYPMSNETVSSIKTEIGKYGLPVAVGFRNYGSSLNRVNSNGYWYPTYKAKSGGHFMTIIGYDDYVNGGSFRVVNNWGKDWGDNGFAWIRYSDFKKFCDIALFTWVSGNIKRSYEQIRGVANYTRNFNNTGDKFVYEGEISNQSKFNGYGIISFIDNNNYYAGWFENGSMNGYFRSINNNNYQSMKIENNQIISRTNLGFAGNNESLEQLSKTNSYIKNMFPSIKFKEYDDDDEYIIIE